MSFLMFISYIHEYMPKIGSIVSTLKLLMTFKKEAYALFKN
jgi:hypothetical protein